MKESRRINSKKNIGKNATHFNPKNAGNKCNRLGRLFTLTFI